MLPGAAPDFSLLLVLADHQGVGDIFSRCSLGQVKPSRCHEGLSLRVRVMNAAYKRSSLLDTPCRQLVCLL